MRLGCEWEGADRVGRERRQGGRFDGDANYTRVKLYEGESGLGSATWPGSAQSRASARRANLNYSGGVLEELVEEHWRHMQLKCCGKQTRHFGPHLNVNLHILSLILDCRTKDLEVLNQK